MERMFGDLRNYWADSKRSQPETGWGAVIHISSRFLVAASWWLGLALAVTLYVTFQLVMAGIGAKK